MGNQEDRQIMKRKSMKTCDDEAYEILGLFQYVVELHLKYHLMTIKNQYKRRFQA